MIDANVAQKATRAAQSLLKEHAPIVVDGRWGSYTENAYRGANGGVQTAVQAVTRSFGPEYTPEAIRDFVRSSKRVAVGEVGADWLPADKARAIVERAALTVGIEPAALLDFLNLEPSRKVVNGVTYYNVKSQNGSYKGLFQFNGDAWKSAASIAPQIGPFSNVFDPVANSLAAAAYAKFNSNVVKKQYGYNGPFTGEVYYTMHNQGAAGFIKILRGGKIAGVQSKDAVQRIARATGRTSVA